MTQSPACSAECRTDCPRKRQGGRAQDLSEWCPAYQPPTGRKPKWPFTRMAVNDVFLAYTNDNVDVEESALQAARYAERSRGYKFERTISNNTIRFQRTQ